MSKTVKIIVGGGIPLFLLIFTWNRFWVKPEFNSEQWKNCEESTGDYRLRSDMLESFEDKHGYLSHSKVETIDLLGFPEMEKENSFYYWLGGSTDGGKKRYLRLIFNENEVVYAYVVNY